jgi:hypothetical protein
MKKLRITFEVDLPDTEQHAMQVEGVLSKVHNSLICHPIDMQSLVLSADNVAEERERFRTMGWSEAQIQINLDSTRRYYEDWRAFSKALWESRKIEILTETK